MAEEISTEIYIAWSPVLICIILIFFMQASCKKYFGFLLIKSHELRGYQWVFTK